MVVLDDGLGNRSKQGIGIQQQVIVSLLANDLASRVSNLNTPSLLIEGHFSPGSGGYCFHGFRMGLNGKKIARSLEKSQELGTGTKKREGFAGKRFWSAGPTSFDHRGV
jgi:hypothetical protein